MAENILIKDSEEIISVGSSSEIISVISGDESFSITEINDVISVSAGDEILQINDVSETINASHVEETIAVSNTEEVLTFDFQEQVIINTTNNVTQYLEEDLPVPYNTQVDFVSDTTIYKGWALPGTSTASALWRIQRLDFVGPEGDVVITWADGDGEFDNIWDNRASLTYS